MPAPIPPSSPGTARDSGRRGDSIAAESALAWRHNLLTSLPGVHSRGARYPSPGRVIIGCGRPPDRCPTSSTGASAGVRCDALVTREIRRTPAEVRIWKVPDTADLEVATLQPPLPAVPDRQPGARARDPPSFRCEGCLDALARRKYFIPRGVDVHRPAGPYQNRQWPALGRQEGVLRH
jgi:hypothetical protein